MVAFLVRADSSIEQAASSRLRWGAVVDDVDSVAP